MRLKFSSLIFLWSLFWIPSLAAAIMKVPLVIVLAKGPNGVKTSEAYSVFYGVRERYREIGIELKLKRFIEVENTHTQTGISYLEFGDTLRYWRLQASKRKFGRRHWAVYVMAPPIAAEGRLWIAGLTGSLCERGSNVALGNATMLNASGLDRFPHSQVIMQHELGHILGASHFEEVYNIMSSIANNQFIDIGIYPPWAIVSAEQIYFCDARQHLALSNSSSDNCLLLGD